MDQLLEPWNVHFHHGGAQGTQFSDGPVGQALDLRVRRFLIEVVAKNPDAGALQTILVQELLIGILHPAFAVLGHRVLRVMARDHFKDAHRILDSAAHRPANVVAQEQGNDAVAAGQPHRRAYPDKAVVRGRPANGVPGVRAQSDHPQVRSDGSRRTAAGTGRDASQVVRVSGNTVYGTDRNVGAEGQFRHVGLAQDNRPCLANLPDLERIVRRQGAFERQRAAGGLQIVRIVIVLHNGRNPMQRPELSCLLEFRIQLVCPAQGIRVKHHESVQSVVPVIGRNPIQIHLHQLPEGQISRSDLVVDVRNRRFHDVEAVRLRIRPILNDNALHGKARSHHDESQGHHMGPQLPGGAYHGVPPSVETELGERGRILTGRLP